MEPQGLIDTFELGRAERGAALLGQLPSDLPTDPGVARVLDQIPERLGVTFVSPIFRALAHWPGFFVEAWEAYAPRIATSQYTAAVEQLHVQAAVLPAAEKSLRDLSGHSATLRGYLELQQRLLPELLLLASAWYGSASGLAPDAELVLPSTAALRTAGEQTYPGPAPESDPGLAPIYRKLADLHGQPRVLSVYRVIGNWPEFLSAAAPTLYSRIKSPEYRAAQSELLQNAAVAARTLGMPAVPAAAVDGPADILALFRTRLIPALILDTAILLTLLDGDTTTTITEGT